MTRAAAEVYRTLPAELTRRIPEHGSRRVLSAISAELEHRTPEELTERTAANWEHWRYRVTAAEPIRDPVALAIRLTRRGLDCPDVRCEDGHQLDLNAPCKACALATAEHAAAHAPAPDQTCTQASSELQRGHGVALRHTPAADAGEEETTSHRRGSGDTTTTATAKTKPVDGRPYAALARALLKARTAAEREKILAHQTHARTA